MDDNVRSWLELIFRWTHVVAGVMWIGHLYFFNFVNSQVAKTYDADSKKKVIPELMPRALYWFRWGAAYTWITGILLLGVVYYMQTAVLIPPEATGMSAGAGAGIGLALLVVSWLIYDTLWKAVEKQETVGVAVSYVLTAAVVFGLTRVFTGRAVFIHLGAMFGTLMAANVWMRIWPAQKKIIAAAKGGPAPDPALGPRATLRSKHNTYMSVPLIFAMVSNHYPAVYGSSAGWIVLLVLVALGWGVTKLLYIKSATSAPAQYESKPSSSTSEASAR